jgi:hypothetical protein
MPEGDGFWRPFGGPETPAEARGNDWWPRVEGRPVALGETLHHRPSGLPMVVRTLVFGEGWAEVHGEVRTDGEVAFITVRDLGELARCGTRKQND